VKADLYVNGGQWWFRKEEVAAVSTSEIPFLEI